MGVKRDGRGSRYGIGWLIVWAISLILGGCSPSSRSTSATGSTPLLLVVVVDSTASAVREREQWKAMFPDLLQNYLPEGTLVAFVRCDHQPLLTKSIVWTGFEREREAIKKAFSDLWEPVPCSADAEGNKTYCGTDVVGAFETAVTFAAKPENRDIPRKLIIAWTDMQPDPCRARGQIKPFRDPFQQRWDRSQTERIELVIHGVPLEKQPMLRERWAKAFKVLKVYGPGEAINIRKQYDLEPIGGAGF
jgi:hypothetical protein